LYGIMLGLLPPGTSLNLGSRSDIILIVCQLYLQQYSHAVIEFQCEFVNFTESGKVPTQEQFTSHLR
jgi:hypothetical protein